VLAAFSMHIEHDLGWTEGHYAKVHEAIVAVSRNFLESDGNIPIERGGDIWYVDHRIAFLDRTSELVHPRADGGRTHTHGLLAAGSTQPSGAFAIYRRLPVERTPKTYCRFSRRRAFGRSD